MSQRSDAPDEPLSQPHLDDVGTQALDNVYGRMEIDAEWSVRGDWTFSWWAKGLRPTRVGNSVTQPVESYDMTAA